MEFSTLATIAGLAAAAVTVLYILKLRKRRIEVPFSPLWRQILVEHKQQSDLWRKLRRFLSWLLHILMVALLAFALADPHMEDEVVEGRHLVILVDASASMAATDVSGGADRLDVAKSRALEILETMGPDDRAMVVAFSNQVQPLSPFVSEASVLEQPLREIAVQATGTDLRQALRFAADSLADKERGELVILSDGALDETDFADFELGADVNVRHLEVGESADNIAITAFNVRRYIANKLDFELFLRVQSFFDRPVTAEIQIFADGRLVDTKRVDLEPQGVHQQFYPSQAVAGEQLEARVRLQSADARDVFPLDDRAYALLPPVERASVLVVTEGNLYVEGPLLLNANLDVKRIAPAAYDPTEAQTFDMVVFDRFTPAPPERGRYFYIDPGGENSPWEETGTSEDPIITRTTRGHPLMRWITLKDVNIGEARRLKMTREDDVVASSALGVPILFSRAGEDLRLAGLSFDVRNSDLPLRVAFPVLLLNLVDWFGEGDESLVESYATGETWSIPVDTPEPTITVVPPSGTPREVPVHEGKAVVYGDQTGFWTIGTGEHARRVASNLVNPEESRVLPRDLEFAGTEGSQQLDELVFERHEIWIWALLVVLALLMLEWVTYNRRITV